MEAALLSNWVNCGLNVLTFFIRDEVAKAIQPAFRWLVAILCRASEPQQSNLIKFISL